MAMHPLSSLLRRALGVDAVASLAAGLALAFAASPLAALLLVPRPLLFGAGLVCIGYAAVIAVLATRARLPGWAAWTVIVGNLAWAAGCVLLAFGPWLQPSAAGIAFLLVQGLLVAGFAELQYLGLRRSRPPLFATGTA